MKTKTILTFLFFILFLSGCKKDSPSPVQPVVKNAYSGEWQISFKGAYTGSSNIVVDSDGFFTFTVILSGNSRKITELINGSFSSSGFVSADIYYLSSRVGNIIGISSSDSANGDFQTSQPITGTWSATKNNFYTH